MTTLHYFATETRMPQMPNHLRLSVALLLLVSTSWSRAADYNWTNAGGGNWNIGTNWSGSVIPGASDNATLGGLANPYTVALTDSRSINNLTVNSSGATLSQTGTLTVGGAFNLTAGSYGLSSGSLVVNGTMTSAAGTTFNWTGGSMEGTGTVTLSGAATFAGGELYVSGNGNTLAIGGTTTLQTGNVRFFNQTGVAGQTLRVNVGGVLDATGDTGVASSGNNGGQVGQVNVLGTLRKSGSGTLTLFGGVNYGFADGSTIDVAASNLINFQGTGTIAGTVTTTGAGKFNLTGGTLAAAGNATLAGNGFLWSSGEIIGTGTVTLSGAATFAGGELYVSGNGNTLAIGGTTTLQTGNVRFFNQTGVAGQTLRVNVGGVLDATGDTGVASSGNNGGQVGQVNVLGTLRKSGSGTLTLFGGVNYGFADGSTIDVAASNLINFQGTGTIAGTVTTTGAGKFNLTGGTLAAAGNATLAGNGFLWSSGEIIGTGTVTLSGAATFAGGELYVSGNGNTLAIGGTTTLQTGNVRFFNQTGVAGQTLRVNVGGVLDATGDTGVASSGNNGGQVGQVNVLGTLRKSGSGTLTLFGGVNYGFADGSTIDVAASNLINFQGTGTIAGTVTTTGAGKFNLTGGTLAAAGNATLAGNGFLWSSGEIIGTGTVTLSGAATFAGGELYVSGNGNTLAIGGTTTLQTGNVRFFNQTGVAGQTLRVNVGGVLDATGDTGVASSGNNGGQVGQVNVLGTLRKSGSGTLNLTDGVLYDVSGTAEVNSGTMLFGGSSNLLSHSGTTLTKGTWKVSNATLDFNGRTVQTLGTNATVELSGTSASFTAMNSLTQNNGTLRVLGGHTFTPAAATVNNAGLIEVGAGSTFAKGIVVQNNGTLRGGGAVTGNVTAQSGSTVAPGTASTTGTLTVNGNTTLQSGSTLNLKLNGTTAGTNYDRLTVNGTVDLGNSTLLGNVGYSAAAGDKLFILVNDGTDPITGTFNGLPDGSLVTLGGYTANISYFADSLTLNTTGGNDVVLYNFSPVPEPGSVLAVVVLAVGTVAGVRRWMAGRRGPVAVA